MNGGMSGSGSMMGAGNNINASQMTGNSFKDSGNKPQFGKNPRISGGENYSISTGQKQSKSDFSKLGNVGDLVVRGVGTMASLCVPGMEGAENLRLNAPHLEDYDIQFSNDHNSQSDAVEKNSIIKNTISGEASEIDKN